MSPYLFSGDFAATELGRQARAATTVAEATLLSISDVFAAFTKAREAGDKARMEQLRQAVGPQIADELDGFDYLAAA